jgi:hypothetical protein
MLLTFPGVDRAVERFGELVATTDSVGVRYQSVNEWQTKGYVSGWRRRQKFTSPRLRATSRRHWASLQGED